MTEHQHDREEHRERTRADDRWTDAAEQAGYDGIRTPQDLWELLELLSSLIHGSAVTGTATATPFQDLVNQNQQGETVMSNTQIPDTATGIALAVTDWLDVNGDPAVNDPTSGTWAADDGGVIISGITPTAGDDVSAADATLVAGERGTVTFTFTGTDDDGTVATASVTVDIVGADAVTGTATATAETAPAVPSTA